MLKSMLSAAVLALTAGTMSAVAEDADYIVGPVVGLEAPSLDAATKVMPEGVSGEARANGTALVFVRSADWCPFCKTQMKDLKTAAAPLAEAGWSLAAISYDSTEILEGFAAKEELNYTLYSDPDSVVISDFNLLNTDIEEGSRFWGIPHPAIVFIRNDGTVGAVLREDGYKDRPQVDAVLETAALLNAASGS